MAITSYSVTRFWTFVSFHSVSAERTQHVCEIPFPISDGTCTGMNEPVDAKGWPQAPLPSLPQQRLQGCRGDKGMRESKGQCPDREGAKTIFDNVLFSRSSDAEREGFHGVVLIVEK